MPRCECLTRPFDRTWIARRARIEAAQLRTRIGIRVRNGHKAETKRDVRYDEERQLLRVAPPPDLVGVVDDSFMSACQSGIGTAGPVQAGRSLLPGKPVPPIASDCNVAGKRLLNSPMPPWI